MIFPFRDLGIALSCDKSSKVGLDYALLRQIYNQEQNRATIFAVCLLVYL